jgi:hypothetical protein
MRKHRPRHRWLTAGQLASVRGAGILLPALGKAKQTASAPPAYEEIAIAHEGLERQR